MDLGWNSEENEHFRVKEVKVTEKESPRGDCLRKDGREKNYGATNRSSLKTTPDSSSSGLAGSAVRPLWAEDR